MTTQIKFNKPLPSKAWELIELALKDLEHVEGMSDKYRVNMAYWHDMPNTLAAHLSGADKLCNVCLAGSILVCETSLKPDQYWNFSSLSGKDVDKLFALDSFRKGAVWEGLREMGYSRETIDALPFGAWANVVPYERDADAFKRDMRKIADMLKPYGL